MLIFENVWVRSLQSRSHAVLCGLTGAVPTDRRVGILCASKVERRAFIDIITGVRQPAIGRLRRAADISSPVGRMAGIVSHHTLRRNCVFAAKMHRLDAAALIRFVSFVANIEAFMDVEYKNVPAEIATAFRYALSYGLPYETYLLDGEIVPNAAEFPDRFTNVIQQRAATSGFLVISNNVGLVRRFCDVVAVIQANRLVVYSNAERAIHEYTRLVDLTKPDVDAGETLLSRIRRALKLEDWPMVAAIANSEMEDNPGSPTAIWLQGELALARGDRRRGIDLIVQACQANPTFEEPWKALVRVADDEQDEERLKLLAGVLITSGQCRVMRMAAKIIEQSGPDEAAVEAWRRVAGAARSDPGILVEAGDRLFRAGAMRDSAAIFAEAFAADPTSGRLLMLLYRSELTFAEPQRLAELTALIAAVCPEESERAVRLAARVRRSDKALDESGAPALLGDGTEEPLPARIRRLVKLQDRDALAALAQAERERDPDGATTLWLDGEIALLRGDARAGGDLVLQACRADADLEEPWKTLGRLAEEEKDETRLGLYVSMLMTNRQARIRRLAAKAVEATEDEESIVAAWRAVAHVAGPDLTLTLEACERLFRYGAAAEATQILAPAHEAEPGNGRILMLLYRCGLVFAEDERLLTLAEKVNAACPEENDRLVRLTVRARRHDLVKRIRERLSVPA